MRGILPILFNLLILAVHLVLHILTIPLVRSWDSCLPVRKGAWFMDVDFFFFRAFGILPSKAGNIFATMGAKARGPWGCPNVIKLKTDFVRAPGLEEWFSTPWFFPSDSPVLAAAIGAVSSQALTQERWIMYIVLEEVRTRGLQVDIEALDVFNPVAYLRQG